MGKFPTDKIWKPWHYQCVSLGHDAHVFTVRGLTLLRNKIVAHTARYGAGLITEISLLLAADECEISASMLRVNRDAPCHHVKVLKEGSLVQADAIVKHLVDEGVLISERSRNHRHGHLRLRPKVLDSWFVPRAILLKDVEEQWYG